MLFIVSGLENSAVRSSRTSRFASGQVTFHSTCPMGKGSANYLPTKSSKEQTKAVFTLNVNYIQLNYDSIYHTPFDFIQLWFYSHLRKFKSQSKVENKMAPYRTAAMLFTAILDLEARRKAKEASKARRRKLRRLKQQQRMRQTTTCLPFCSITHCNYFKQPPWGCLK